MGGGGARGKRPRHAPPSARTACSLAPFPRVTYVLDDMSAARLNARIDDTLAAKVEAIRRVTGETTTQLLKSALDRYHAAIEAETRPYAALVDSGFIGCAEGPRDLSASYKAELTRSLAAKLAPRPAARAKRRRAR